MPLTRRSQFAKLHCGHFESGLNSYGAEGTLKLERIVEQLAENCLKCKMATLPRCKANLEER